MSSSFMCCLQLVTDLWLKRTSARSTYSYTQHRRRSMLIGKNYNSYHLSSTYWYLTPCKVPYVIILSPSKNLQNPDLPDSKASYTSLPSYCSHNPKQKPRLHVYAMLFCFFLFIFATTEINPYTAAVYVRSMENIFT